MVFLHINLAEKNAKLFNKYVESGKQIFVIFYMEGCGPCNATRPEWKKMENVLKKYKTDENVVIADVDQIFLKEIKYLAPITGFPTIRYISNKGKFSEDYENCVSVKNKDRTIDSFVEWVNSKVQSKPNKPNKFNKTNKPNKNSKFNKKNKYHKTNKHHKTNKPRNKTNRYM